MRFFTALFTNNHWHLISFVFISCSIFVGPAETRFVGVVSKKPFGGFVPPPPPPLPPVGDADQNSNGGGYGDASNSDTTSFAIAKEEKGLFDDVTSVLFTGDSFGTLLSTSR